MVPNRCFFIFLDPMRFSMVSYLAIRSAAEVNDPDEIVLYHQTMPSGPWWEAARPYVTRTVAVDPPRFVGDAPLEHPAHRADVLRLELLLRDGGVYLDLDVICRKPLTPFRDKPFVLGQEGKEGQELCNGVILAEPGSEFAREWLAGFDPATSRWAGFRSRGKDQYWNELSCRYPAHLATLFPDLVHIAPYDSFHWPLWHEDHLEWLFLGNGDEFPNAYCHHLWQTMSWEPYLKHLTPEYVQRVDTNFNLMVRPYLEVPSASKAA
jgi:hypothetical protein